MEDKPEKKGIEEQVKIVRKLAGIPGFRKNLEGVHLNGSSIRRPELYAVGPVSRRKVHQAVVFNKNRLRNPPKFI